MKSITAAVAMAVAFPALATPAEAAIYRGIRQLGGPLTAGLEITTDGTLGTLSAGNVLYFKATFSGLYEEDIANYGAHPTVQSASVTLDGTSLTATAGRLYFDFDSGGGVFGVASGSYYLFTAAGNVGWQPKIEFYELDSEFSQAISQSGVQELAAVPEPASWAMLIAGFGLVGASMRRRRGLPA